jgi:hypothetical protein
MFSIKRSNHEVQDQTCLMAGKLFEEEPRFKVEAVFKDGVSKLCKVVFKSDASVGKKLTFNAIQSKTNFYRIYLIIRTEEVDVSGI